MKPFSKRNHSTGQNSSGDSHVPVSLLKLNLHYRLPLLAFCLLLFLQSSFPSLPSAPLFPHDDKFMHMGAYGLLAFLAARNLGQERPFFSPKKLKFLAILFAVFYGLSDEIHQAFVPDRTASVWDFAADILGSFMGACFYIDFFRHRK